MVIAGKLMLSFQYMLDNYTATYNTFTELLELVGTTLTMMSNAESLGVMQYSKYYFIWKIFLITVISLL